MGMFDSIHLITKCPYCNQKQGIEFQTKDLSRALIIYKKGSFISDQFSYIKVIGDCQSQVCKARADKRDIIWQGCPSGFGALFDAKIELKQGKVTGKVYDIKIRKECTDNWLNKPKNKKQWIKKYKPRKEVRK